VRPETPQFTKDLRVRVEETRARLEQRKADLAKVEEELAQRRSKEDISSETKATIKAITDAETATEDAKQRASTAKELLAAARALGARTKRLELYCGRVTAWIETELKTSLEGDASTTTERVARETLEELRGLKQTRDRELGALAAMLDEKRENSRLLHGSDNYAADRASSVSPTTASPPGQSPGRERSGATTNNNASQEVMTPKQTARSQTTQAFSARRGVLASPGTARTGNVEPLPLPPMESELASMDLQDYYAMNNDARGQFEKLTKLRKQYQQERVELQHKTQVTKRRIEAELQELAYQQRHESHSLLAKRKRVSELEAANSSLMSSLQYAHATLKMTWTSPVRDYFLSQGQVAARKPSTSTPDNTTNSNGQAKDTSSQPREEPRAEQAAPTQEEQAAQPQAQDEPTAQPQQEQPAAEQQAEQAPPPVQAEQTAAA
jgi:hypothetical protein